MHTIHYDHVHGNCLCILSQKDRARLDVLMGMEDSSVTEVAFIIHRSFKIPIGDVDIVPQL